MYRAAQRAHDVAVEKRRERERRDREQAALRALIRSVQSARHAGEPPAGGRRA